MAMQQPVSFLEEDDSNSSSSSISCVLLDDDALYCQEEEEQSYWGEEEEEDVAENVAPFVGVEQDLFWEDEELMRLLSKEQEQSIMEKTEMQEQSIMEKTEMKVRSEAVEWMVKAISQIGFSSPLTAVLAINYLDRFLISNFHVQKDKPWMIQLVAVTCLSLAAKVEEIHVPLLLDLQVGEAKYVFEAKTIQRMEVVVLSTLKWKMHPVTPLSFLDHIVTRLGLKTHIHLDFLTRCQLLILSLVSDSRCMGCLPSVLAAATMMHVIDEVEPTMSLHYKNQLLHVLHMTKEKVDGCYQLIEGIITSSSNNRKRKFESSLLSSEEENDSISSGDSSWSSSLKRSRLFMEQKSCGSSKFASLNHAFAISSPR